MIFFIYREKFIYGLDPFAPNPATQQPVPFYLGLMMYNGGWGTAWNMRMTSSQPEIVENKKGLLVSFKMIGAEVGALPISPSLTVTLGDLEPQQTAVVRWVMTSSLTGRFVSYSASYEHSNPLGRADVSLVDNVTIYELIHSVRIEDPTDDGEFARVLSVCVCVCVQGISSCGLGENELSVSV